MRLKKVLFVLAMSALMVFSLSALAGCGNNAEQLIRDSLNEEFQELKNPTDEVLAEMAESVPESTFSQLGLSVNDVLRSMLEGFDGTVDDVKVDGDTADAVVTISSKDFTQVASAMTGLETEMMDNIDQFSNMSVNDIYAWMGTKVMEAIDNAPVVVHDPITLQYELVGNTWGPTAGAEAELYSALFG